MQRDGPHESRRSHCAPPPRQSFRRLTGRREGVVERAVTVTGGRQQPIIEHAHITCLGCSHVAFLSHVYLKMSTIVFSSPLLLHLAKAWALYSTSYSKSFIVYPSLDLT